MTAEQLFGRGSTARGLAVVAGLALGGVAVSELLGGGATAGRETEPVCATPVEITTERGTRLGCANDAELANCGPLPAGLRVRLPDCELATMGATARLLVGLPLDVNRASAEDLEQLDGIGPRKAEAIIRDREARGPFRSLADLTRVRGIGPATVEKLAPQLTASTPER